MTIKTKAQLISTAAVIRDETAIGGNTKLRVYNMLVDFADSMQLILDLVSPSTASGTITFDFELKQSRRFQGSASFSTPKTIAFSNDTNALSFEFFFNITDAAAVLTFPSTVKMDDIRWDTGAKEWTPDDTGWFKGHAEFNGTNWLIDISKSIYV